MAKYAVSLRQPVTLLLASALLTQIQAALADEVVLSEVDLVSDLSWVQSATRLRQQPKDIPAAVTVIDRAMIEASGAVNIADLLRLVPGVQVFHVNANVFGVVVHGQGEAHNGRLEVMVDGRSVYLPLLSTVDWSALGIGLADIDRIEVVRGPNVQTQGSNAFLGAINFITRDPLSPADTRITATGGDLKTRDYHISHQGSAGAVAYRFSANYHQNDGTGEGREDANLANPLQKLEDGGEISQFMARAVYSPSIADTVDLQLGVSTGQIGIGSATDPEAYDPRDLNAHFQSLSWLHSLASGNTFKLQASHTYHRWKETDLLFVPAGFGGLGLPDFTIDLGVESGTTERFDVEAEYIVKLSDSTRAVVGGGMRHETANSQPLFGSDDDISELFYRAFGNLEWKPSPTWTFNVGAMGERNDLVSPRLSPRIGANLHLDPRQTARLVVSRSYRTPSLLEERQFTAITLPDGRIFDVNAFTSGDLKPEKITNYELGYNLHNASLSSALDIRVFLEQIDDAIYGVRVINGPYFSFDNQNVAYWSNRGAELQWTFRPSLNSWLHLAYAYVESWGEQPRGIGRRIEQPEDHNPRRTLALLAGHRFPTGFELSFGYYAMSEVVWLQGSTLDAYDRLDLRVAQSINLGRSQGKAELIVQNLLSPYTEFEDNNTFDTRAFLRLSLAFF